MASPRRRTSLAVGLGGLFLLVAAGCGGGKSTAFSTSATAVPEPASTDAEESFPADASATHFHPIHHAAFGPIYGSGCPDWGACGCGGATTLAQEFGCQMDRLAQNDIPVTAYLFDGSAWSQRNSSETNECSGPDCCSWKLGDDAIQRLARSDVPGILHFWGGCHTTEQYQRAFNRLGRNLLGFYLDDGSSDEELAQVSEFMQSAIPGDWEVVAKAFQNREPATTNTGLSKWANSAYVGDLSFDFSGLQTAIDRIVAKSAYIPAPYAEFTGYQYGDTARPDEEVFFRRLQFGALQPVMAHTPYANSDPWRAEYSASFLQAYRYYAWLHKELVPYFYSYAYRMYETPSRRVVRRGPMANSLRVGYELYVPIVTEPTRSMTIQLPAGQWIDYWDESQAYSGTLGDFPVPLGREPIFIRQGSLIPMDVQRSYTGHGTRESKGALTLLVYPSGSSSFRFRNAALEPWITFSSTLSGEQLALTADVLPTTPVIYRIGRWSAAPTTVGVSGVNVTINQGGDTAQLASEAAVNGSKTSGWYYDTGAQRLIVKAVP